MVQLNNPYGICIWYNLIKTDLVHRRHGTPMYMRVKGILHSEHTVRGKFVKICGKYYLHTGIKLAKQFR